MDINSGGDYPSCALSNFAPHAFEFDGVPCASMEGLLQSFKFSDVRMQKEVCGLTGFSAKRRGQEKNGHWHAAQTLWWKGIAFKRDKESYQALLSAAFDALSQNVEFRNALLATGEELLTHSIGKARTAETVLTEQEFCIQLTRLRSKIRSEFSRRPRFT